MKKDEQEGEKMISSTTKSHLLEALNKGIRFDKRKKEEFRKIEIKTGCAETAEGSAEVKIGETRVIAGVKFSIESPFHDTPDEGVLMVNVEESPIASPNFELGPPSIEAIELARVVDRGLRESKVIDFKELCIEKGEKVWFVSVDIVTLNDDGNLLDACGLAALAALADARFPEVVDGNVDYHNKTKKKLKLVKLPVPITVYKIGNHLVVDPTSEEQPLADARLTITTIENGEICALQKGGEGSLEIDEIGKMVDIASEKGKELRGQIKKLI